MIVPTEEIQSRQIVPLKEVPLPLAADETVVLDAVRRLVEARKSSLRRVPIPEAVVETVVSDAVRRLVEARKSSLRRVLIPEAVVASVEGVRKSSFPLWAVVDKSVVSAH